MIQVGLGWALPTISAKWRRLADGDRVTLAAAGAARPTG